MAAPAAGAPGVQPTTPERDRTSAGVSTPGSDMDPWKQLKITVPEAKLFEEGTPQQHTQYKICVENAVGEEVFSRWMRFSKVIAELEKLKIAYPSLPDLPQKHSFRRKSDSSLVTDRQQRVALFLDRARTTGKGKCRKTAAFREVVPWKPPPPTPGVGSPLSLMASDDLTASRRSQQAPNSPTQEPQDEPLGVSARSLSASDLKHAPIASVSPTMLRFSVPDEVERVLTIDAGPSPVLYKVRSTRPGGYAVRPTMEVILSSEKQSVTITTRGASEQPHSDRFAVEMRPLDAAEQSALQLLKTGGDWRSVLSAGESDEFPSFCWKRAGAPAKQVVKVGSVVTKSPAPPRPAADPPGSPPPPHPAAAEPAKTPARAIRTDVPDDASPAAAAPAAAPSPADCQVAAPAPRKGEADEGLEQSIVVVSAPTSRPASPAHAPSPSAAAGAAATVDAAAPESPSQRAEASPAARPVEVPPAAVEAVQEAASSVRAALANAQVSAEPVGSAAGGFGAGALGMFAAAGAAAFAALRSESKMRKVMLAVAALVAAIWGCLKMRAGKSRPPRLTEEAPQQSTAVLQGSFDSPDLPAELSSSWVAVDKPEEEPAQTDEPLEELDKFAGYDSPRRGSRGQAAPGYDAAAAVALCDHALEECTAEEKWTHTSRVQVPGLSGGSVLVQVMCHGPHSAATIRIRASMAASTDAVWDLAARMSSDVQELAKMQPQYHNLEILEEVEADGVRARVAHAVQQIPGLLEPRDFVVLCAERRNEDGSVTTGMRSVQYDGKPATSGCVRGRMLYGLHAVPNSSGGCDVSHLIRLHPGGDKRQVAEDALRVAEWSAPITMLALEALLTGGPLPKRHEKEYREAQRLAVDFNKAAADQKGFKVAREVWVKSLNASIPLEHRPDPSNPGSLGSWRAEAELDGTVEDFLGILESLARNIDIAKRLTPEVEKQSIITTFHVASHLVHKVDKLPWPVQRREFIFLSSLVVLRDGSAILAQRSYDQHPDAPAPDARRAIRGNIHISGFRVQPVRGAPRPRVRVMQLVEASPGGSLPQWLVAKAMDERAHTLGRLGQVMKDRGV
eukprot:TRINITY_DN12742_c0_g1_i1.p1 TRINITY_DN12742_c0_g1~~TRINITY_DN12742_c0_g1_i1.p1  ORF type:complete len:1092 (+),score=286.48 TRINITY_DN12742_c0_g1_i1:57-3278(+)